MNKKNGVRQSLAVSAALAAALFLLPLLCITPAREALFDREEEESPPPPFESGVEDGERMLKVLDGETVVEMDLGTYLEVQCHRHIRLLLWIEVDDGLGGNLFFSGAAPRQGQGAEGCQ